jgi:hypothetical protein
MFCRHNWKKESDVVLPSAYEQMQGSFPNFESRNRSIPYWSFIKTHVLVLSCTKCGKIYKSVESSKQI